MTMKRLSWQIAFSTMYAAAYLLSYVEFLHPQFGYMGYDLYERPVSYLVLTLLMAVAPVLCYRGARALSSVLSALIYLALYIPIIVTFPLASAHPLTIIFLAQLVFMGGMSLLFSADLLRVQLPVDLRIRTRLMRWMLLFTIASTLYVVYVYRGNLRLVSFGEAVYEQRFANEALGEGLVIAYLSSWLNTVFVPLCLAYGLVTRRHRYFVAGAAACLVLYMATAAKMAILVPFVYLGFYVLFTAGRLRHALTITAVMLTTLVLLTSFWPTEGLTFIISSVLLQRTIGNGGQMMTVYHDFFSFYPQTTWSHVNIVNHLTGLYPYGELGVGQVIGQYYFAPLMNANASFWATDGIAAMGLPGVAVASLVCAAVFVTMNSITAEHDPLFVSLCFLQFLVTLLNQSLFSAMWSGGGFLLLLFFVFLGRDEYLRPRTRPPAVPSATPAPAF